MMRNLSALGDAGLLVPACLVLLAVMLATGRRGLAGCFALALALCWGATVAVKLLFRACGEEITDLDLISPSGHASSAALVYGALAILAGTGRPLWAKAAIGVVATLLVGAIAISRVVVGAHSNEEIVFGLALGSACLALFAIMHARIGSPTLPLAPVALASVPVLVLLMFAGRHLSAERWIIMAARQANASFDLCRSAPSRRGDLTGRRAIY